MAGIVGAVALTACGAPADPPTTDVARLTDEMLTSLPCGYQFAGATSDEQVLLTVFQNGFGTPVEGRYELGAGEWRGEVRVGRDLAANWCDDVIESGEARARVDASHPVSGVLEWTTSSVECPGGAVATITELVVEVDGEPVPLGELLLSNESFGCFAG